MKQGRLSYYSAAALGLLGIFFLLSLILSFYGIGNAPGDFLSASFTYASIFIPMYIFIAAILSFKVKFLSKWVILLTLTIFPFLTLVLFLKVYFEIDNSLPVSFILDNLGIKEGSFLLFLLFLVEILLIYVLSMKMPNTKTIESKENLSKINRSEMIMESVWEKDELPGSNEDSFSVNKILRPGISAELLGTSLNSSWEEAKTVSSDEDSSNIIISEGKEHTDNDTSSLEENPVVFEHNGNFNVDLPELPSLDKLRSLEKYSTKSLEFSEREKDISIDFGEDDIEELEEYSESDESLPELETEKSEGEVDSELEESQRPDESLPELETEKSEGQADSEMEESQRPDESLPELETEKSEGEADSEMEESQKPAESPPELESEKPEGQVVSESEESQRPAESLPEIKSEISENQPDSEFEDEIFSEIGTDHLINADLLLDTEQTEETKSDTKVKKKFTYANYNVPTDNILKDYADSHYWVIDDATRLAAEILRETLEEFKIKAEVTGIKKGPVITMFEILPAPGVKLSKIANLADNIAMRLAASRVRIVAPIPGKHAVGIEIPNKERAIVSFKEMLNDDKFQDPKNEIPVAIGKDITGNTQIIDLVKTPHLLIAGATGSGKSVCVNALICSILYKRTPDQVRLILIDPKIVELKLYNDIPHLLTPVITEPKRAFQALQYCIFIMEQRYSLLDGMGVRDIRSYNKKIIRNRIATKKLPYIVVVVDEFADLIATSGKELESILARLAAMARAVGIHLVLATQRPSIDVITGLIKANIPSRIAFMVSNKIDSRIILDTSGADKLLGQGDMLFSSAWDPALTRMQGAFLSDSEVEAVTAYVKTLGEPDYIDDEIFYDDDDDDTKDAGSFITNDPLMDKAIDTVVLAGKASASYLQRRLQIGYNRAARIVEEMEARGIVGPPNGSKPREILHVPDRIKGTEPDNT